MMAQWDIEMSGRTAALHRHALLLLVGEDNGTVPPRVARDANAGVAGGGGEAWKGRGHTSPRGGTGEVAEAISAFLASLREPAKRCPRGDMFEINDLENGASLILRHQYAGGVGAEPAGPPVGLAVSTSRERLDRRPRAAPGRSPRNPGRTAAPPSRRARCTSPRLRAGRASASSCPRPSTGAASAPAGRAVVESGAQHGEFILR